MEGLDLHSLVSEVDQAVGVHVACRMVVEVEVIEKLKGIA